MEKQYKMIKLTVLFSCATFTTHAVIINTVDSFTEIELSFICYFALLRSLRCISSL